MRLRGLRRQRNGAAYMKVRRRKIPTPPQPARELNVKFGIAVVKIAGNRGNCSIVFNKASSSRDL